MELFYLVEGPLGRSIIYCYKVLSLEVYCSFHIMYLLSFLLLYNRKFNIFYCHLYNYDCILFSKSNIENFPPGNNTRYICRLSLKGGLIKFDGIEPDL